jgi:hypothetical protein
MTNIEKQKLRNSLQTELIKQINLRDYQLSVNDNISAFCKN